MRTPGAGSAPLATATRTAGARRIAAAREIGLVLAGTAAIALIGQISLPLPFTPVPVTLGTLAALGVGSLLGSRRALASVALFAALAALGAPVLAGWGSGVGASFGYVIGYAPAAVIAGRAAALARRAPESGQVGGSAVGRLLARLGLMVAASAVVYVPGLLWLKVVTGAGWSATLAMGLAPFVVGDLLKSAAATLLPTRHR